MSEKISSANVEKHSKEDYQKLAKKHQPKPNVIKNCLKAFVIGGAICTLGQGLSDVYVNWFGFPPEKVGNPTVATLVFISCLLTGLGVYDRIAQWAGAGTAVPVTGFANAIASAALEHRSEGFVLGVGGNMFKLAGSVIVFGTVAAFFIGIIHYFFFHWIN